MLASAIQLQTVDRTVNSLMLFAAGYAVASLNESLSKTDVAGVDFRSLIAALFVAKDVLNYSDCFGRNAVGTCMWMADLRPSKRRC
jgi:4-hydroxybenzoate polyprenyltransferase